MLQYVKRQDRRSETDTFGGGGRNILGTDYKFINIIETIQIDTYYDKIWSEVKQDNDDIQYKNPNVRNLL